MERNSIPILHGQICFSSHKTTTEQTKLLCQTSSTGCYLPKPQTSFSLTNKSIPTSYFTFTTIFNTLSHLNSPCSFPTYTPKLFNPITISMSLALCISIRLNLFSTSFSAPTYSLDSNYSSHIIICIITLVFRYLVLILNLNQYNLWLFIFNIV